MMSQIKFDYEPRRPTGPPIGQALRPVTTALIAVNVAIFFLDLLSDHRLLLAGYFSADAALGHFQLWRFVTFQFLHANFEHILFNMFSLFFFGPMVEDFWGAGRYLAFYLLCGTSGAAMYLILMYAGLLHVIPTTPLIGASAGIFGILIAASQIAPNAMALVMFIPMRLRTMAWLFIGWAVFTIFRSGANAGGEAAHLGGAALGFLLIRNPKMLNAFNFKLPRRRPPGRWGDKT